MTDYDTISGPSGIPQEPQPPQRRPSLWQWIEYSGYLAIRFVMRLLPFKVASFVSASLWRIVAPNIYRHPRALKHLKLAYPDKSDAERKEIALKMWSNLGRTMAESFLLDRIAKRHGIFEFHIPAEVQELISAKRQMIFATLHLGNWELPAVALQGLGIKIAGVYRHIENPLVDHAIRQTRAPYYPLGILEKGQGAGKILMRLVKQKQSVGIVSDLRDGRGVRVPFFGMPAKSTTFPAILSTFDQTPLVAIQCVRLKSDHFKIEMKIITAPQNENRDEYIYNLSAALQAQFEVWVRETPDQWMWAHRRWGKVSN